MLTYFVASVDFPCRQYSHLFSRKKHKLRITEEKLPLFLLLFYWCVSIRILMRRVYINPDFYWFGTTNLLGSAKPCPFGYRSRLS